MIASTLSRRLFSFIALLLAGIHFLLSVRADVPRPVIQQFQPPDTNGSVLLRWDATPGAAYRVLTCTNLGSDPWAPVDYLVARSNSVTWLANGQSGSTRFYKLSTDAIAISSVEPSIIVTGAVTTVYVIGQGFGADDVLQLLGPGGPWVLTNRVVISPTLISFTAGPTFTPDVPGTYQLQVSSGSSGQTATSKAASLTVSATPGGSVHALYEPPQEPPASPQALLSFWLTKKGYDYYQAQSALNTAGIHNNPAFQENQNQGEMPVHSSGLTEEIRENDTVVFDIQEGKKGLNAVNVKLARMAGGGESGKLVREIEFARYKGESLIPFNNCGGNPVVQPFSGEVQLQAADLAIPGRGLDFIWARTYRARPGNQGVINFSQNRWTHSYDVSVAQTTDGIAVADGTGRGDVYYPGTNGVYSCPEFFNEGTLSNGVFTLTFPDTGRWVFNPLGASATSGKLAQIIDRSGNMMALAYDTSGRLAEIVDDLDRTNHIAYNSVGQLASVTDFSGRTVTYQYYGGGETGGSPGDLKSVTSPPVTGTPNGNNFPEGKTTTYTYSTGYANDAENHLLLSVIDGKGQILYKHVYQHNQTDLDFLRCVSAQDGTNDSVYYTYAPQIASPTNGYATITVTVRDALGNVSDCSFNSRNLPVKLREYTGRAPLPGPVTATDNRPTGRVRDSDPAYYDTQWRWNQNSLCVQEIEPLGNSVSCVYETDYNPNASPRKQGDLRVVRQEDPNGDGIPDLAMRFDYDPRFGSAGMRTRINELEARLQNIGILARQYDPRFGSPALSSIAGFLSKKGYDYYQAQSQLSAAKGKKLYVGNLPFSATQERAIPTKGTGPNGQGLRLYSTGLAHWGNGFVISATDPNGNTATANYDAQGNRVKVKLPWLNSSTADEDFIYNTHGQLTSITHAPDGNGYRQVDTINYYTNGPQLSMVEVMIASAGAGGLSLVTAFERDARGNVTRCIDPRGNDTLYTYNSLDQLVQSSSPALGGGGGAGGFRIATQYTYDAADNLTMCAIENRDHTGALGANPFWRTQFVYDQQNRLTGCWRDKNGALVLRCTEVKYDANNNVVLFRSGEAVNGNDTNKVVKYLYDERNLLFCTITAPGTTIAENTDQGYDGNGNLVRVQQSIGPSAKTDIARYAYDRFNRCVSVADAMGNYQTNRFDANGNLVLSTLLGAAGSGVLAETAYQYDVLNRPIQWTLSPGDGAKTVTCAYAPNGDLVSVTDANGHVTAWEYDSAGRSTRVRKGMQDIKNLARTVVACIRDAAGNVVSTTQTDLSDLDGSPQVFTRTNVYDSLHRCISTADNVGNTDTFAYDSRGNLVLHIDSNAHLTSMTFDGLSRCTGSIADLNGDGVLDFVADAGSLTAYDDNDCALSTTDDNTNSTFYAYDACNRLVLTTHADGTHSSSSYDLRGNVVQTVDPNGSVVTFTYDLNNRCVRKDIAPNGAAEVAATTTFEIFGYDGCSRLVLASNNVSRLTFAYDLLGNCTTNTQDGLVTTRTFDGVGNCLSMTYPGGRVVQYTYDTLDQVSSVVSRAAAGLPPTTLASYAYDGPGRPARITRHNGTGASTEINWNGLVSPPNATGDHGFQQVARISHTSSGGAIYIDQRRFTYDQKQNKTTREQMTEFVAGQGTLTNRWFYDPLNQLSRAINTKGTGSKFRTYHLDAEGNRLEVTNDAVVEVYTRDATSPPADFQVNQYTTTPFGNELHDDNGNRVQVANSAGQLRYVYDYASRLVFVYDFSGGFAAPVVSFTYDALGQRLSKTSYSPDPTQQPDMKYYVHGNCQSKEICGDGILDDCRSGEGCGNGIIEERTGGPGGGVNHVYCFGGKFGAISGMHRNESLARFSATGQLEYYFLSDDLGNTLALTDAGGSVIERYEYDDFGAPQFLTSDGSPMTGSDGLPVTSSPLGNPFLFHGREWDNETGLYFEKGWPCRWEMADLDSSDYFDPQTGQTTSRRGASTRNSEGLVFNVVNPRAARDNNPWSGGGGSEMRKGTVKFFNEAKGFGRVSSGAAKVHWTLEVRFDRIEMK